MIKQLSVTTLQFTVTCPEAAWGLVHRWCWWHLWRRLSWIQCNATSTSRSKGFSECLLHRQHLPLPENRKQNTTSNRNQFICDRKKCDSFLTRLVLITKLSCNVRLFGIDKCKTNKSNIIKYKFKIYSICRQLIINMPDITWVPVTKSKNPWKLGGSGGLPPPPRFFLKPYN